MLLLRFYVCSIQMNAQNKVQKMIKIWNAAWALKELGWGIITKLRKLSVS